MDHEISKEDWLRQELRGCRGLLVSLVQWGIAVLAALEVFLYYMRQDMTVHLRDLGRLHTDALLPMPQWLIGTLLLWLIAYIFARYADRIGEHYRQYRLQLVSMTPTYSTIAELTDVTEVRHRYAYYAFPAFDFAWWLVFFVAQWIGGRFDLVW
jgi:hypothetical protein